MANGRAAEGPGRAARQRHRAHELLDAVVALERRGLGGREVENQRWYAWEVSYRKCVGPLFRERIVMLSAGEVDDVFGLGVAVDL